jgi:hypothetical protein
MVLVKPPYMRTFDSFRWLVAAAVAATLPVTVRAATGHSMGGFAGGGPHHSMGVPARGGPHVSMGQRFGHGRFFDNHRFVNNRFVNNQFVNNRFVNNRFVNNRFHDHFFRHRNHFIFVFDFAAFGFPWWYPYPYPYYGYPYDYYAYDYGPDYDYQYWRNLAVSVQSELARRGYYHGQVDGVVGSGSRQAIRAFQAAQGLPETGLIDPKLLKVLGISYRRA